MRDLMETLKQASDAGDLDTIRDTALKLHDQGAEWRVHFKARPCAKPHQSYWSDHHLDFEHGVERVEFVAAGLRVRLSTCWSDCSWRRMMAMVELSKLLISADSNAVMSKQELNSYFTSALLYAATDMKSVARQPKRPPMEQGFFDDIAIIRALNHLNYRSTEEVMPRAVHTLGAHVTDRVILSHMLSPPELDSGDDGYEQDELDLRWAVIDAASECNCERFDRSSTPERLVELLTKLKGVLNQAHDKGLRLFFGIEAEHMLDPETLERLP